MKNYYLSPNDFETNCPCNYNLTEYAKSLVPNSATVTFWKGHKSQDDENTYIAEFTATLHAGQNSYKLEVSCTILPDRTYSYKTIRKSENL